MKRLSPEERVTVSTKDEIVDLKAKNKALREAAAAALESLNGGRCIRCGGRGRYAPPCPWCRKSPRCFDCPPSRHCEACDGKGYGAPVLALRALLEEPG